MQCLDGDLVLIVQFVAVMADRTVHLHDVFDAAFLRHPDRVGLTFSQIRVHGRSEEDAVRDLHRCAQ